MSDSVTVCAEAKPAWFDPHNQIAGAARVFADNITPGLLRIGDDGAPAPSLATSWHWESATSASLTLENDRQFASGRPVDATAVNENLMRVVSEPGAAFNGEEFRRIAACETNGACEVIVRLTEPFAPIVGALANGFGIVDLACGPPPENTVGAGPYFVASRSRHAIELVGRSSDLPAVSWRYCTTAGARRRRISSGCVDVLIGTEAMGVAQAHGWQRHPTPAHGPLHLAFNLRKWPTSALGFRQAVASSVDRADLIAKGLHGLGRPAETPYPSESAFSVGSSDGGRQVSVPAGPLPELLLAVGGDAYLAIARAAARVVEAATGASVRVVSIPNPEWWPHYYMSGEWDLAVQAWTPMPDPDFVYGRRYASWGVHNACGYESPRVDAAVRAAQRTVDPDERLANYRDAEEARSRDLPTVYLSFPDRVCCVRPGAPAPRVRPSWEIQLPTGLLASQ